MGRSVAGLLAAQLAGGAEEAPLAPLGHPPSLPARRPLGRFRARVAEEGTSFFSSAVSSSPSAPSRPPVHTAVGSTAAADAASSGAVRASAFLPQVAVGGVRSIRSVATDSADVTTCDRRGQGGLRLGRVPPAAASLSSFFGNFLAGEAKDLGEGPNMTVGEQREQHNFFLDRGLKFNISYRSPMIRGTDMFDLDKFGCTSRPKPNNKLFRKFLNKSGGGRMGSRRKEWWIHPAITFGGRFGRIGVRLQDLTSGELRWDAIYDLAKAPHKPTIDYDTALAGECKPPVPNPSNPKQPCAPPCQPDEEMKRCVPPCPLKPDPGKEDAPCGKDCEPDEDNEKCLRKVQNPLSMRAEFCSNEKGTHLCPQEVPVGGAHPFFVPDWCPAPNGKMAHRYRLTITNLSPNDHPEQEIIGEMFFTEYGPVQLDHSYSYESTFGGEAAKQQA